MAKKKNRGKKGGGKSGGGNVAGQDGSQGTSAAQDNGETVGIAPSVKDNSSANHVHKAEVQAVSPSTASTTEGHASKKKCDKQAKAAAVKVGTWRYFILL